MIWLLENACDSFLKGAGMLEEKEIVKLAHQIKGYLEKIKFGSVTLVIQDGKVIQSESHEKVRLTK